MDASAKKWRKKNRKRMMYINHRSIAKRFIQTKSTLDDLDMLEGYIRVRRIELNNLDEQQ